MEAKKKQIKTRLLDMAREGKVSCRTALGIAEELGVSPIEVGRMANELQIKISSCQLGCFR